MKKGLLRRIEDNVHNEHFIITSIASEDDVKNDDTIWLHRRQTVCLAVKVFKNGIIKCDSGATSPFFSTDDDEPYSKVLPIALSFHQWMVNEGWTKHSSGECLAAMTANASGFLLPNSKSR
jgi:hypothetical protein